MGIPPSKPLGTAKPPLCPIPIPNPIPIPMPLACTSLGQGGYEPLFSPLRARTGSTRVVPARGGPQVLVALRDVGERGPWRGACRRRLTPPRLPLLPAVPGEDAFRVSASSRPETFRWPSHPAARCQELRPRRFPAGSRGRQPPPRGHDQLLRHPAGGQPGDTGWLPRGDPKHTTRWHGWWKGSRSTPNLLLRAREPPPDKYPESFGGCGAGSFGSRGGFRVLRHHGPGRKADPWGRAGSPPPPGPGAQPTSQPRVGPGMGPGWERGRPSRSPTRAPLFGAVHVNRGPASTFQPFPAPPAAHPPPHRGESPCRGWGTRHTRGTRQGRCREEKLGTLRCCVPSSEARRGKINGIY